MLLTTDLNPKNSFTRVPNEVIFAEELTAHEFHLWIRLLALQQGRNKTAFATVKDVADKVGMKLDMFRSRKRELRRKGFLTEDRSTLCVTVPDYDFVAEEAKDLSIADEESVKPKRKPTGLSPADRKAMIKEAWNTHKPDWCAPISGTIAPPLYFAIEAQTKHLEHDRDDYDGFMKRICAALSVSKFWRDEATKPVKAHGVFGWGTPADKKFRNCEGLYSASSHGAAKAKSWNTSSDSDWISWYQEKGFDSYTKVERIIVEDRVAALQLELDKEISHDTIRIYQKESGYPLLWTNDSHRALVRAKLPSNG